MAQKIYGHRGASGYAPENTLEAFELAAKQGAMGVELDVHICKTGEVVVAHDEDVDRVSNGHGAIREMSLSELKALKFNRTHPEYEKAVIPTLREVYELLEPLGLEVNVELKNSRVEYPGLEEKCLKIAEEAGMNARILYSSFNHYSLGRVKALDPAQPCGILYDCWLVRPWKYAKQLGLNALHPHFSELLIPGECERAHEAGLEVNPWTVNEEKHLRRAIKLGADRIITNFPDRALSLLNESL